MSRWRELYFEFGSHGRPVGSVVVVDRHLALVAREAHGQLAARVDLAVEHVGHAVAGLDAAEPRLEDRRRVVVRPRQHQRAPVEEHDRERLAGLALIALISSSCLPGRSSIERASASPLISRVSPTASTTWSAACAAATAAAKPASDPHSFAGSYEVVVAQRAARRVRGVRVLRLHAVEQRHGVVVVAAAPPRAEHVVLVVAERADDAPSTWSGRAAARGPSFFSSTSERPAALRAAARFSRQQLLALRLRRRSTYGCSNSPARNFTRRMRRTASLMRRIDTSRSSTSCGPKSR